MAYDDQINRQPLRIRNDFIDRIAAGEVTLRLYAARSQQRNGLIEQSAMHKIGIHKARLTDRTRNHGRIRVRIGNN